MRYCRRLDIDEGNVFEIIVHIRNESYEKGTKIQIAKRINRAKTAGFKSGTPDLFLSVARGGYHGLFIEMKRKNIKGQTKGKTSKKQLERLQIHANCGYACAVAFGCDDAIEILTAYLQKKM